MPFEVLTMGRVGVDVYPLQTGVGLAEVTSFGKYLGGSPTNVAVAAARYGRTSAVITKTGADPFGDFVRTALDGYGVDTRYVGTSDIAPTPVTFCEIFPPDDFPLYFYRLPKAPDLDIEPTELDLSAVRDAGIFWVTGTGLSEEPSRTATLAALEHRAKAGTTVFDLDWRPRFGRARQGATPPSPVRTTRRPCATPPSPSAISTNARWRPASASRTPPRRRCWPPGWSWPWSSRARRVCWPWTGTASPSRSRRYGWRW
ncbi:MAG: hypothetical protein HOY75_06695 [Streptomyces sp.]|nr:hypothetical protein [Streptomyces sp.]